MRSSKPLLLAIFALFGASPHALAWGDYGHRTTAAIAEAELSPLVRREIARLLAVAPQLGTPTCPLGLLGDASVWPDCVRHLKPRFSFADHWHYVDVSICGPFVIDHANCPDGDCVTAQIDRFSRVLADRTRPPRERLEALAFVTHFIGDLHQPLHVGENDDRGGNEISATFDGMSGPRLNLHGLWDREFAERAIEERPAGARGLRSEINADDRAQWRRGTTLDWARESWVLSRDLVYPALNAGNVCRQPPQNVQQLDLGYYRAVRAAIRTRIEQAGIRLAVVLERALGSDPRRYTSSRNRR